MLKIFSKLCSVHTNVVYAVSSGQQICLEEVKDDAFAQKILGEGVAIIPDDNYVVAPCNGTILMVYPTKHAIGMINDDGLEILIHIGIDTVKAKGIGFKSYVMVGDKIKRGTKLVKFDYQSLKNSNYDMTIMVLFPNNEKYNLSIINNDYVRKGKDIVLKYESIETK